MGEEEALTLAKKGKHVIAARGKKVISFDLKSDEVSDETLLAHLLGPSGNLRAPSLKVGKTLIVGFNEEMYQEHLS